MLREPMLYLSLFLKQHRARYHELLDSVRRDGDWEAWVTFFCEGVASVSDGAVSTARRLLDLAEKDRDRLARLRRKAGSAAVVQAALLRTPVCTIPRLAKRTGLTLLTNAKALDVLVDRRIVSEPDISERAFEEAIECAPLGARRGVDRSPTSRAPRSANRRRLSTSLPW